MASDRWRQIEALYEEALETRRRERERFLDERCGDDRALREEVESLLRHGDATHAFFDGPAVELPPSVRKGRSSKPASARIRSAICSTPAAWVESRGRTTIDLAVRRRAVSRHRALSRACDGWARAAWAWSMRCMTESATRVVALKTLRRTSAADLYRLKREFRSLADVTHPNLVCLYELFVEDDHCFFTMELVEGVSFVDYADEVDRTRRSDDRLIAALRQLVDGVSALHRRGKLHRDIKPSNVLVTPEGRVVILDFGLIAELLPPHAGEASYVRGGTPAYMSPEEASGATPSEAGDWYGVGVTLYEALTGTIPVCGSGRRRARSAKATSRSAGACGRRAGCSAGSERHLHGPAVSRSRAAPVRSGGSSETDSRRGTPRVGDRLGTDS